MSIRYLFDDLKKIGNKKYISRYNEENVYYIGKQLQIEIVKYGNTIDLLLTVDGIRNNYTNSHLLLNNEKLQIQSVLSSFSSETIKAKTISQILLNSNKIKEHFRNH